MNIKQREKWQKIRQIGKKKYVIKYGIISWGLTTAFLWSLIMHIIRPQENLFIRPVIALVLFPLGGIVVGLYTWNYNEKNYK
ncbi:MAG: hypothetical protein JXK07_16770 [Spirochaetes bacterium]|nr:hypothetical protein [Spirochaetota bacterium]MBN2772138.1 hypothetical protein [Spirochaetota bacterium]